MPRADDSPHAPLYLVLGEVAGMWALAMAGYYWLLPALGYSLSYNSAPIVIALYFLLWSAASIFYFWGILSRWLRVDLWILVYAAQSLLFALLVWALLYAFSLLPILHGPTSLYSDLLVATPWYFLPKAVEILLQQLLITVLVLELSARFHTLKKVVAAYAFSFGLMHVFLFLFTGAPVAYAAIMTAAALLSALMFPYLILRVRGGFVYAYGIQLAFYIFLAMFLHAWPPPGYGVL